MIWIGYTAAWISTAAAVIAGMYFTGSAWCLWALLIPAMIKINNGKEGERSRMKKGTVEIEMPENCFECPLRYDAEKMSIGPYEFRQLHRCLLQPNDVEDIYLRDITQKRQKWCPLKEIPDKDKKEADGLYRKWQILNDVIPLEKALKPCRMCGGNYIMAKHRAFGGYKAKCMSCECEVRAETSLDIVDLWNGEKL